MKNILLLTRNIDEAVGCLIADSIDETAAIARQAARSGRYTNCFEKWFSLNEMTGHHPALYNAVLARSTTGPVLSSLISARGTKALTPIVL